MRLFLAILLVAAVACATEPQEAGRSSGPGGKADDGIQVPAVYLDEADDGRTVEVVDGYNVVVRLYGNPSTGYDWLVASTNRTFGYPVSEKFIPDSDAIGSGGVVELTWATDSPLSMLGSHTVLLEYRRPWETEEEPLRTFSFTADVVEPYQQQQQN